MATPVKCRFLSIFGRIFINLTFPHFISLLCVFPCYFLYFSLLQYVSFPKTELKPNGNRALSELRSGPFLPLLCQRWSGIEILPLLEQGWFGSLFSARRHDRRCGHRCIRTRFFLVRRGSGACGRRPQQIRRRRGR